MLTPTYQAAPCKKCLKLELETEKSRNRTKLKIFIHEKKKKAVLLLHYLQKARHDS